MWQNAIFTSVVALKQRQLLTRQFNLDACVDLRAIPSEFLDANRYFKGFNLGKRIRE